MIKRKKILVIGDIMLDRYWMGSVNRISPEAPVPIIDVDSSIDKPGGAANVAKNLSDFGMDVTLVGISGKDEASGKLSALMSNLNIVYKPLIDSKIRTTMKLQHCKFIRVNISLFIVSKYLTNLKYITTSFRQ